MARSQSYDNLDPTQLFHPTRLNTRNSVMIFFNALPLLFLAVTGKQESVLEKRSEEATEINYQHQGKWPPWSLRMEKNWFYYLSRKMPPFPVGRWYGDFYDKQGGGTCFDFEAASEKISTRWWKQFGSSRDVIMAFPQTKNSRRRPLQSARMSSRMSKIYLLGQKFASRLPTRASL